MRFQVNLHVVVVHEMHVGSVLAISVGFNEMHGAVQGGDVKCIRCRNLLSLRLCGFDRY